uniref:Tc1-like transposase DDE domain-containing protein n=1 Tax=Phytophthora ramorum TaxID=164328 RepID=H3GPM9_PHYRM
MIWGSFSAAGKSKLAVLQGRQTSEHYVYTVSEYMLPFAHLHHGMDYIYQQDNTSIHRSKFTTAFFEEEGIRVLDWPARSPDLNPIENVWAMMTQIIYHNGKQYDSAAELTAAIYAAWEAVDHTYLRKLIDSMPRRCIEVISKQGNTTHY